VSSGFGRTSSGFAVVVDVVVDVVVVDVIVVVVVVGLVSPTGRQ
jgi:hypothetical protein